MFKGNMLKSCGIFMLLLAFSSFNSNQGTGSIRGKVTDKISGKAIPFASIIITKGGNQVGGCITDFDGNYIFVSLSPGKYDISTTCTGYKPAKLIDLVVKNDEPTYCNIMLEASSVILEEVVLTSQKPAVKLKTGKRSTRPINNYENQAAGTVSVQDAQWKSNPYTGKNNKNAGDQKVFFKSPVTSDDVMKVQEELPIEDHMPDISSGVLTAGELNDFSKWKLWEGIKANELKEYQDVWKMYVNERYSVQVITDKKMPVIDATVYLKDKAGEVLWQSKTDNTGKAELWAGMFRRNNKKANDIEVSYQGKEYLYENAGDFDQGINKLIIATPCNVPDQVDIAFVVDATASMDDEISFLKAELNEIIGKTREKLPDLKINIGSVFYRCFGNSYVTKLSDFSDNINTTTAFINDQNSGEGGDEAVEEALDAAVNKMAWSSTARTRLVFLILDEMPLTNDTIVSKVQHAVRKAAEKGIRIIPVVGSAETMSHARSMELLMRSIALATNGTYVFLTDHSKIGSEHSKPVTDQYDVELLNNLMMRLIYQFTYVPDCETPVIAEGIHDTMFVYTSLVIAHEMIDPTKINLPDNPNVNVIVYEDTVVMDTVLAKIITDTVKIVNNPDNMNDSAIKTGFKYYPNPTYGPLTLEVDADIKEVFLADISGKLLEKFKTERKNRLEINISKYPNGIYFLQFFSNEKWQTGKVILTN